MLKSLLKLWPFFREYKGRLILMLACGGLMSLCQATVAPIIGYLFDRVFAQAALPVGGSSWVDNIFASTTGNDPATLVWVIPAFCIILYFINGVARYTHFFIMRYTGDKVSTDLREKLLQKYLRLNLSFHNNYASGSGGLLSRTLNDVYVLQNSTGIIADFIREPILALLLLSYMISEDWKLTATILIAAPVLGIILGKLAKSLRKYGHLHQEVLESMTSTLKEGLDGVRIIQSFNLQEKVRQDFRNKASQYLFTRRRIVGREEVSGPVSELVGAFVFSGMVIYFGTRVLNQTSSPGVFLSFVTAMGFMQKPIKKIQDAFIRLQQTVVSTDRVLDILSDTRVVEEKAEPASFPQQWSHINFENVGFSYRTDSDNELVVDKFDLKVKKGEVVALVGTSGSGKSTVMHLLERFFDPTQGSIKIDDRPIQDFKLEELRKNIALVTQDVFLFNDTIENNIRFGDLEKEASPAMAAKAANASSFIEKLPEGMQTSVGERGSLLSGGEKQRISIARAIYKDSPILILDEATSALDSVSEIEVQKGLEQLMEGRTVFVIAHRLSTIKKADRILVLNKGRILEEGTHEELISKQGDYFNFYKIQMSDAETQA